MLTPLPDATAFAAAIHAGSTTAATVTETCLARIAARDADVRAWAFLDPAQARDAARAADACPGSGPLHGVPIGIKDIILTRDQPTGYNSPLYPNHNPGIDAACVELLRHAGAIILGKTATTEFAALGKVSDTTNPHASDHTPGGSSSGSGAAVADGQVPIALGTQTGGSIIRPASFCGVWALKPTWGSVSLNGVHPFAPSLDTLGWFARSARDLQLMLAVLALAPPQPRAPPLRRIGLWRTAGWPLAGPATRAALAETTDRLRAHGVVVEELPLPPSCDALAAAHGTIMRAEGRRSFLAEHARGPAELHPRMIDMIEDRPPIAPADLRRAHDVAAQARLDFDRTAAEFDAILSPSTIGAAPHGLSNSGDLLFNGLFSLLHVPCVNLPLFTAPNGLPLGLTLSGPRYADAAIVAVAGQIETLFR